MATRGRTRPSLSKSGLRQGSNGLEAIAILAGAPRNRLAPPLPGAGRPSCGVFPHKATETSGIGQKAPHLWPCAERRAACPARLTLPTYEPERSTGFLVAANCSSRSPASAGPVVRGKIVLYLLGPLPIGRVPEDGEDRRPQLFGVGRLASPACSARLEPGEDGEDSAIVRAEVRQVDLGEDARYVLLDRTAGDHELMCDSCVAAPLGHQ